jgi:hypothetical protein
MAAKLQPLIQGVIKNLKHHYRKRTVRKMLDRTDDGKIFDITLLGCVMELDKTWHEVSSGTSNCFEKVGICKDEGVEEIGKKMTIFRFVTWNSVNLRSV